MKASSGLGHCMRTCSTFLYFVRCADLSLLMVCLGVLPSHWRSISMPVHLLTECEALSLIKIELDLWSSHESFIFTAVHSRICDFVPDEDMIKLSALSEVCMLVPSGTLRLCNCLFQDVISLTCRFEIYCTLSLIVVGEGLHLATVYGPLHFVEAFSSLTLICK